MPPVMPRESSRCSHLLNSSIAAPPASAWTALDGAGFAAGRGAGASAGFTLLALAALVCAAGPVGILTLPPAPTVAQPLPGGGATFAAVFVAVGPVLLARSAYLLPALATGVVLADCCSSLALTFLASSSRCMSASVFLFAAADAALELRPGAALMTPGFVQGLGAAVAVATGTGEPLPQVLVVGRAGAAAAAAFSRSRAAAASASRAARRAAAATSSAFAAFLASASWISFKLGPFCVSVGSRAHGASGGG
jgi:hypothetical protein